MFAAEMVATALQSFEANLLHMSSIHFIFFNEFSSISSFDGLSRLQLSSPLANLILNNRSPFFR